MGPPPNSPFLTFPFPVDDSIVHDICRLMKLTLLLPIQKPTLELEKKLGRFVGVFSAEHADLDLVGPGVVDVPDPLPAPAHRHRLRAPVLLTDNSVGVTHLGTAHRQLMLHVNCTKHNR